MPEDRLRLRLKSDGRTPGADERSKASSIERQLLLTYDFPPIGGGIARLSGELAKRYPPGTLLVSTGLVPGSEQVDGQFPNPVDRAGIKSTRLRTVQGLLVWSHRVSRLATRVRPGLRLVRQPQARGLSRAVASPARGHPLRDPPARVRAAPAAASHPHLAAKARGGPVGPPGCRRARGRERRGPAASASRS